MSGLDIEFEWPCDPEGYQLVRNAPAGGDRIVPNRTLPRPPPYYGRPLLKKFSRLFVTFTDMATTSEGALRFVSEFGPLTWDGWDAGRGDDVQLILLNAGAMRQLMGLRSTDRGRSSRMTDAIDAPMPIPGRITGKVVLDRQTDKPVLRFAPDTLESALWLQLALELAGGVSVRQCRQCNALFAAGPGTGRRADAQFCSDAHRITFNSLERSKEK
jgi:hypothetical protein